ncbi:MAG: hypothetical protein EXR47_05300 [Dehalococcoidia bacterium]|nr:hypothetical protein [Dehalococcoidia bacterium]
MTTATDFQVFQAPQVPLEAIDEVQSAVIAASAVQFEAWTKLVRSQQQLAEAGVKFWFKALSLPQA